MRELLETVNGLKARGIHLVSLEEHLDTSSVAGEIVFHVFGSIAHFQARLISERTRDGIAAARKRGRQPGRPPLDGSTKIRGVNRRWQLGPGTGFIASMTRNSGVPRDCIKFDPTDLGASLRKGQARMFAIQDGIVGEARIVERAFGVGPCVLTEAITLLQDRLASAET